MLKGDVFGPDRYLSCGDHVERVDAESEAPAEGDTAAHPARPAADLVPQRVHQLQVPGGDESSAHV